MKISYIKVLERRNGTFWMLMFAEYAYKCFCFQWEGRTERKDFYRNWLTKDTDNKNKIETIILLTLTDFFFALFLKMFDANQRTTKTYFKFLHPIFFSLVTLCRKTFCGTVAVEFQLLSPSGCWTSIKKLILAQSCWLRLLGQVSWVSH